jgi:hypothetical protein
LRSVERHSGRQIRAHPDGQLIDYATAKTIADTAELTGAVRTFSQPICHHEEIFRHLGAIEFAEKRQTLLVISGVAAEEVHASGANAMKLATTSRRATSSIYELSLRFSWITMTDRSLDPFDRGLREQRPDREEQKHQLFHCPLFLSISHPLLSFVKSVQVT